MSLCPVCGRVTCDHTSAERFQTTEEIKRPLTADEEEAFSFSDKALQIMVAKRVRREAIWGGKLRISPADWPNKSLKVKPGDLTQFAPLGNSVYGYQARTGDPFTDAPWDNEAGGIIYFGNWLTFTFGDIQNLLRILGITGVGGNVGRPIRDFAVFVTEATNPKKQGYLTQVRFVTKFGLRYLFDALSSQDYDQFPEQSMDIVRAVWTFMEHEKTLWGTSFTHDKKTGLRGLFGGDGNYAREQLAFGLMVENENHVFRLWSRAWLVTK